MITAIFWFVVVLALLVLVHEFGHFFVARWAGIKVEEFGFGFPPRLKAWKGKVCEWSVNWLPLGGFVKLKGEDGTNTDEDSYASKTLWQRFLVVFAGPAMNFILAGIVLGIGFMIGLPQILNGESLEGAVVSEKTVQVVDVLDGSAAQQAGFMIGDEVIGVSSLPSEVEVTADLITSRIVAIPSDEFDELIFLVRRGDEQNMLTVEDGWVAVDNPVLGVGLIETGLVSYPFFRAIVHGFIAMYEMTLQVVFGLWHLFSGLFTGSAEGLEQIAGPVGIATLTGEVAGMGFIYMLQFIAVLSVNLGVLNLLPIPALDGGRIFFMMIELVTRRPVNKRVEQMAHIIGFALLMLLVLIVTVQDVGRIVSF